MSLLPDILVYVRQADLRRRVEAYLGAASELLVVEEADALEAIVARHDPTVLVLELCADDALPMLRRIRADHPETRVIALGLARSDPALEAETLRVHAVEDPAVEGRHLQALARTAREQVRLARQNRTLSAGSPSPPAAGDPPPAAVSRGPAHLPLHHFARAFRHFDNVNSVFENIAEAVASCAGVSRAGLFAIDNERQAYTLRAGIKCFEEVHALSVPRTAPLVQWMERQAHLVSRARLSRIEDAASRDLLARALDMLGAEVLVPLHGRRRLIGWLFVGHRATGAPFTETDLEDLSLLSENVSLTIENALLYGEVAVQKTLAETVLHAIPIGIVAVDADGVVRWFNRSAETILGVAADQALGRPAGRLGEVLAGLLARGLKGDTTAEPVAWVHPDTALFLSTTTRRLVCGDACLGVVAITGDQTRERALRAEQEQVERATFWTELAAAISHEVRNPLVAISTFAQLLPERYDDAEFRSQFSELATSEISRLDSMIDQINDFANPPALAFEPLDILAVAATAAARACAGRDDGLKITVPSGEDLPHVRGDKDALAVALGHLLGNALEAVDRAERKPAVKVSAVRIEHNGTDRVAVTVKDNGPGIPDDLRDKVFSPFCSSKARGIGLGLPIAKRTATDHGGEIRIESDEKGTAVTLEIPVATPEQEDNT